MDELAIELSGLVKAYDGATVIDELDLAVPRGQTLTVLGPNGAGKTTTVEICEGHRRSDAGSVRVLDTDPVDGDARWRDRLGIVSQQTGAFDRLTVAEAVGHVAGFHSTPHPVGDVLERVGLTEHADRRVDVLSGGQRRRVDLACGIVGRPELLFLDEPTTGLDPEARRQLWRVVEDLKGDGTTVVLTTHLLDEAEVLSDRVVVLAGGRIVADAPVAELGGRHDGSARVRVRRTEALASAADRLSATDLVDRITHDQAHMNLHTTRPTAVITRLAADHGGELPDLAVLRASLEDTYLQLITEERSDG